MRGLPQKQNACRAYKIRLCGHLRRYKKIVKKTYIISTNKYVGCFMASSIKKMFFYKYGFSDMCTQKVLKQEVIVLPVKKDASPDWEYMEEYMKKMEKTAVERMNLLI